MKLWNKNDTKTSAIIEQFTVGRDREFDLLLARYDVEGSLAHTAMLAQVGLLEKGELQQIHGELKNILAEIQEGRFAIDPQMEDIHSQVEWMLTSRIGEAGKKIHSGRSRNDQVALDIKLFLRAEILALKEQVHGLFDLLMQLSDRYRQVGLPGYTHLQVAMPSSFGLWFGAFGESLIDDLELLAAAFHVANKNPLGSGAGYGSTFPLDRSLTTQLLHFEALNVNSVYAQMTRGKTEKITAMALSGVSATLGKLAMDCCLYMSQNFNFIRFPDELTTGSSLMPHKKNPDVFELIRGRCNRIQATPNELTLLMTNLPSGYHRDYQLTKEILFPAFESLKACLDLMQLMLSQVTVREDILKEEKYRYLYSVDAVNRLVMQGIPFRDAYRKIGEQIQQGTFEPPVPAEDDSSRGHEGSIQNLCNDQIRALMQKVLTKFS